MNCWICGNEIETASGEHVVKASDIRSRLGRVSPDKPVYVHVGDVINRRVRSVKSDLLKSAAPLCAKCNNELTQPYDLAWEQVSTKLGNAKPLRAGDVIGLHKIFPGRVGRSMLDVHLFFVKGLGCKLLEEAGNGVDLEGFRSALLGRRAHPYIHIAFLPGISTPGRLALANSEVHTLFDNAKGRVTFAAWMYALDFITVRVLYAEPEHTSLPDTWHPTTVGKFVRVGRLRRLSRRGAKSAGKKAPQ